MRQCAEQKSISLVMVIEGGQKATPATYTVAGHVAEEVVNEMGSWIGRRSTRESQSTWHDQDPSLSGQASPEGTPV